jgi:hypothetical protein
MLTRICSYSRSALVQPLGFRPIRGLRMPARMGAMTLSSVAMVPAASAKPARFSNRRSVS